MPCSKNNVVKWKGRGCFIAEPFTVVTELRPSICARLYLKSAQRSYTAPRYRNTIPCLSYTDLVSSALAGKPNGPVLDQSPTCDWSIRPLQAGLTNHERPTLNTIPYSMVQHRVSVFFKALKAIGRSESGAEFYNRTSCETSFQKPHMPMENMRLLARVYLAN